MGAQAPPRGAVDTGLRETADTRPPETADTRLLELALSRPNDALKRAGQVLAARPGPLEASVAHQAIGIVQREFGDIGAAVARLRTARRLASRGGSADREADVLATLGVALVFAGRPAAGRNALNAAARATTGVPRARVLLRRGGCLLFLGRHRPALDDLNGAISVLRAAGDRVWEARALTQRSQCYLMTGSVRPAAADLRRAEALYAASGQELESAAAVAHRGVVAFRLGDLPEALARFDEAAGRYAALGVAEPDLSGYRCGALSAAGLAADALREADAAAARLARAGGRPAKRAELLLVAAEAALAAGEPAIALRRATEARGLFARHGRGWWRAHAEAARVRAAAASGPPAPALLGEARRSVRELAGLGSPDLPLAQLAAGRIALSLAGAAPSRSRGRAWLAQADALLAAAAAGRGRGPALSRAAAWLAEAHRAQASGDTRRLMRACRRGLSVLDEHRGVLGSSELRARSTAHGAELAELGQRHAARLGRPRLMLDWSERWRAVALAVPPVGPPADPLLQADLAALRAVTGRLARARERRLPAAPLEQERRRLERAVRARALLAPADGGRGPGRAGSAGPGGRPGLCVTGLLDELGADRLVELVSVGTELHALVCGAGRVRRFPVGPADQAARAVRLARLALRRVAHGPAGVRQDAVALGWLASAGERLDLALLGAAGRHLGDGNLVIVPPGRLHAVPWGLLPRLRDRAVSVAPSAACWLRARRPAAAEAAPGGQPARVVLVRGPGLASRGAEVPRLAADYAAQSPGGPVVLGDGTATAAAVLAAIDGAELAHIAAHGTFRADSPLCSSLRLDDGPVTVYDLERLRRGPRRLVLSSCESAITVPAGANEVLGLASSLIPLGTTGIVASVVPVNDRAAVPLMIALHRALRGGASLPQALRSMRRGAGPDPVSAATAGSFICLGS